ncbi:ATP-binding protein [Clostridium sp. AL.422]|uniref:sensor histidine kinase n=1 Tax=Clostridium TaxID=1485 RepID=UPI00293DA634|nr:MULTISPECIES: ATP-binding protein [unclassified Clostridium]MDV4151874.1 ATP-binding protein [Clostridium sp. AL.422]
MIGRKKEKKKKVNEEKRGLLQRLKNFFLKIFYKFYNSKFGYKIRGFLEWIFRNIEKSIRFELMVVFLICFVAAFLFYGFANKMLSENKTITSIQYDSDSIQVKANSIAKELSSENNYYESEDESSRINGLEDEEGIMSVLDRYDDGRAKIYLTDLDGKILFKINGDVQDSLDIYTILDRSNTIQEEGAERTYIYPINISGERAYLVYYETPTPYISYDYYTDTNSFLALILSVIVFISIFIIVTNKKMKYIEEIASGVKIISSGDLSYRVDERGKDEIKNLAEDINNMASEIQSRMEAERRSEKTKSELITNVSHDLRTPLTSVMGYIGLIKEGKYEDEAMMKEYLNIAFNKSNQLKELIEDLFEYTKINNQGIILENNKVNIVEFLSQIIEEYIPIFEENEIEVIKKFVDERSIVEIDASKMVRVFENLFSNAIKYSFKPGRVIVSTFENNGFVTIQIKNNGENIPKEKVERLFDRFYRVDEARNSNTKGSGLGLAISKNIVKLHDGDIWAECIGNEISFYIKLKTTI